MKTVLRQLITAPDVRRAFSELIFGVVEVLLSGSDDDVDDDDNKPQQKEQET